MRIFFVSLLAALLLVATASVALGQDSGADATDTSPERSQETQAGGNTDWIRTVGILGIAGVWSLRGINSVAQSRRERRESSTQSANGSDDAAAPQAAAAEGADDAG